MVKLFGGPDPTIVRSAKIAHLCASALVLISGMLLIFMPQTMQNAVRYLIGIGSVIIGVTGVYGYFSNDSYRLQFQSDLALGAFNVIFGVLLLISPEDIDGLFPYAVGIFVILDGVNKLQISVEGKRFGMSRWLLILASAVVEVGIGVVTVVCASYDIGTMVWMGVAMTAIGAVNFWTTLYTVRVRSGKKEDIDKE